MRRALEHPRRDRIGLRLLLVTGERPLHFGKGVRLREEAGGALLLVPEGVLELNATAAAALALVDGRRSLPEIVASVRERFEVSDEEARESLGELFGRLRERGFIE